MVSYVKTKTKIAVSITLALAALITAVVMMPSHQKPEDGPILSKAYPSSTIGIVNGCGPTYVFKPTATMYGVLPSAIKDTDSTIPKTGSIVKTYGYMSAKGLSDKILGTLVEDKTAVPLPTILRSLYENRIIIWYTDKADSKELARIERIVSGSKNAVALPWTDSTPLPYNRTYAIAAWGVSQTCLHWDSQIIIDFIKIRNAHTIARSIVPPVAPVKPDGSLYLLR